jgi:hypothetical protein
MKTFASRIKKISPDIILLNDLNYINFLIFESILVYKLWIYSKSCLSTKSNDSDFEILLNRNTESANKFKIESVWVIDYVWLRTEIILSLCVIVAKTVSICNDPVNDDCLWWNKNFFVSSKLDWFPLHLS